MKIIRRVGLLLILLSGIVVCAEATIKKDKNKTEPYKKDWIDLSEHVEAPEWFKDSKLGIYFHWGPYCAAEFGGSWYARNMNYEGHKAYDYHTKTFGDPKEFGYHDLVDVFKAEKFDAEEWADLFVNAGAKFAGPVAEHHDGFSMWDSDVTPWNAKAKGPKKDITGELQAAITARDLKFITTFHHARHLQRYHGKEEKEFNSNADFVHKFYDSHYPLTPGTGPMINDKELNYLYGNLPKNKWEKEVWLGKLKEVIDKYQPDIIWFDSWLHMIPEKLRLEFCSYYLNEAKKWGKEVVIVRKQNDLPLDISVDDLEKLRKNKIGKKFWMTDETLSTKSWSYVKGMQLKPTKHIFQIFIDIVSKNGVLLLNISPKPDGTIPNDQKQSLLKMGDWLKKYGEAIYGTRSWYSYGEGPTQQPIAHYSKRPELLKVRYTNKDVRYTQKGNNIYAIIMGSPDLSTKFKLESFARTKLPDAIDIEEVSALGSDEKIEWELNADGLVFSTPSKVIDEMATVFKIKLK